MPTLTPLYRLRDSLMWGEMAHPWHEIVRTKDTLLEELSHAAC